jgi:hypothetical protein
MDPLLPPDPAEPRAPASIAQIRTEDHVVWNEDDRSVLARVEPRFVVVTWLESVAAALVIVGVSALIVRALSDRPLTGGTATELGVLTILAAMGTFLGFAVVLTLRLVQVSHDRLANAIAIAALHLVFAGIAAAATVTFGWSADVLIVFERTAAATIVGCGLAVGMVPAVGSRPTGTQTDATPTERQL